jgi:hypothetical protein
MENPTSKSKFLTWISDFKNVALTLIAIATAFLAFWNKQISEDLNQQLQEAQINNATLEALSTQVNIDINQKKFSNEQFLLLNREVRESLSNKADCDQHLLLAMLVDKMLADDVVLRDSIRSIIKKREPSCSATAYILNEERNEMEFKQMQIISLQDKAKFRVDIFYLEDLESEAKPRAEKIQQLLKSLDTKSEYNIRVRLLPKSINSRSGYMIDQNQIRFDPQERPIADSIQSIITKAGIFELEPPILKQIDSRSPNYLSIFVRNM